MHAGQNRYDNYEIYQPVLQRNTLDCLKYIRQLKEKNIPVYFEKENINTLDSQRGNPVDHYGVFGTARKPIVKPECKTGHSVPISARENPY
ncbi:MAG: hypothetical protein KatS3mg083_217 [Candidatus Dojkabacteria bacterium]|nr:MAG: hypothetical protein KatS3mg083_217 [Candidatus Dojkabacteria bacterium]